MKSNVMFMVYSPFGGSRRSSGCRPIKQSSSVGAASGSSGFRGVVMTKAAKGEAGEGRARLIQTAQRLFAEKGFDSVTVRDIAGEAAVSIGLINHHFGSKDGLRAAVDDNFIRQFEEALSFDQQVPTDREPTPEDYSLTVDQWIGRHQDSWPNTVNYFRRALLEESDWGFALFSRFYEIVQRSVTKMDVEGRVSPDVDRLWLPFLMIYLELGTMLLDPYIKRTIGKSGFDGDLWRRRHRAYSSLLRRGLAPRRPSDRPEVE